jgi:hypothetical protein
VLSLLIIVNYFARHVFVVDISLIPTSFHTLSLFAYSLNKYEIMIPLVWSFLHNNVTLALAVFTLWYYDSYTAECTIRFNKNFCSYATAAGLSQAYTPSLLCEVPRTWKKKIGKDSRLHATAYGKDEINTLHEQWILYKDIHMYINFCEYVFMTKISCDVLWNSISRRPHSQFRCSLSNEKFIFDAKKISHGEKN